MKTTPAMKKAVAPATPAEKAESIFREITREISVGNAEAKKLKEDLYEQPSVTHSHVLHAVLRSEFSIKMMVRAEVAQLILNEVKDPKSAEDWKVALVLFNEYAMEKLMSNYYNSKSSNPFTNAYEELMREALGSFLRQSRSTLAWLTKEEA